MALWLYFMCGLVALMVTVGGATRLTDSGLSITEWDLIIGTFPPLGQAGWEAEFEKYKQIPEYSRVNFGMTLSEFKYIYWWEWGHRNLGRFIGLAFLVPWLWFWFRGMLQTRALKIQLALLFVMICGQGALGWYMVSSGLVDRVDVSQYRLAAHLGLAFVIFAWMFSVALQLTFKTQGSKATGAPVWGGRALILLTFLQVVLGAFVAGLRAGKSYNTWPLMNGEFFPSGYFIGQKDFLHAFETVAAVQFNHRIGAYVLLIVALVYWQVMRRAGAEHGRRASIILLAIFAQALLGIWTVMAAVPVALGLIHQLGALVVVALLIHNLHVLSIGRIAGRKKI